MPSAVDLLSAFRIERLVENRRGQIDALADPHGARMRAEQGAGASVLFQQATHREGHGFGLIAVGQLFGGLFLPFLRGCSMIASGPGNTRLV